MNDKELIDWYVFGDPFEEDTPRCEENNHSEEIRYEKVSIVRLILGWLFH